MYVLIVCVISWIDVPWIDILSNVLINYFLSKTMEKNILIHFSNDVLRFQKENTYFIIYITSTISCIMNMIIFMQNYLLL